MMKKLFMKHENLRKYRNRIAGVLMSVVLAAGVCMPVQAADANTVINGAYCYVTLTDSLDHSTASTISPLTAYHSAQVYFHFYYTDDDGSVAKSTTDSMKNNSASVTATAYGTGNEVRHISSRSSHQITYGATNWTPSLNINYY